MHFYMFLVEKHHLCSEMQPLTVYAFPLTDNTAKKKGEQRVKSLQSAEVFIAWVGQKPFASSCTGVTWIHKT